MAPITKDPVTRAWAVVTSAGVLRLGLGFVASLLIARALGPSDFGVYAVLAATVGIVGSLAEGGLTEAAVLRISAVWPALPRAARARAGAFVLLRIGVSMVVVGLGCAMGTLIASSALGGIDAGLLRWALIGIVATAASGSLSAVLQAIGAFKRMSSLTLINTGLTAALAAVLAALNRLDLLSALVILGIGTSLLTFAAGAAMLPRTMRLHLPSLGMLEDELWQLFRTGRWLWLASLFAMLTVNAEVLLLNHWAVLSTVGTYALALNLASKADLVNQSLYTVLLPSVGSLDVRTHLRAYVQRGLIRSLVICAGLLVLIPLSTPLITFFYGAEFAPAATFFQLLLGVMMFDVLLTPVLLLPLAYRQPKVLAGADAARAGTLVLVALALIPVYGPFGAIAARFAARISGAAVVLATLYSGRQTLQVQHPEPASIAE